MRVKIHPSFWIYLCCIAALSSLKTSICALSALVLHEAGHALACAALGEQISKLELTPFGGVMYGAPGKALSKGVKGACIAAAGPAANYAALLALSNASLQAILGMATVRDMMIAHLSMLCLNLFPVLPLDGGNLLFCIGYYLFPVGRLTRLLSGLGMLAGAGLVTLAGYGLIKVGELNCSLALIGGYLCLSAVQNGRALLIENQLAVLQERILQPEAVRKMQAYYVPRETRIHTLLVPMEQVPSALFFFEGEDGGEHYLSEKAICSMMMASPMLSMEEAWRRLKNK